MLNRLKEVSKETKDEDLQNIIDYLSNFYSMSIKVFENNSDAN